MKKCLFGFFVPFALVGCTHDPVPAEQLRLTQQVIVEARAAGAVEQTAELALAEEKLAAARAAMRDGRYRQARMLAEQAELDARLAEAKVLNEKSRTQVLEVNRRIDGLRHQLGDLR